MFTYLLINLFVILVPLLFSFDTRVAFYTRWKYSLPAIVLGSGPFLVWDIWFAHKGFWGFTSDYILGSYFWGLPLEEWFFFIAIPYAGIFTYNVINSYFPLNVSYSELCKPICLGLALVTFFFLAIGKGGIYTVFSLAFVLVIIALVFIIPVLRPFTLKFLRFYAILLVPFLLVNGILTGMFLEKPVVWYHPEAILGIRIITIPLEDVFFGLALMYLILLFYELFQANLKRSNYAWI
ncbi:MAG: lycopene cyclase domain-containing protein [Bacteroidales bacterium]